jgi:hypothetical protein
VLAPAASRTCCHQCLQGLSSHQERQAGLGGPDLCLRARLPAAAGPGELPRVCAVVCVRHQAGCVSRGGVFLLGDFGYVYVCGQLV